MRLPSNLLLGLSMALASVGVAGCGLNASAPTNPPSSDPNAQQNVSPGDAENNAQNQPGKVCLPDSCPACGRG